MVEIIEQLRKIERLAKTSNWNLAINEAIVFRSNYNFDLRHTLSTYGLCIPHVLLAGPARTATTWLRGTLGKHPNIRVALDEPHILLDLSNGNLVNCLSRYSQPELWRGEPKQNQILCEKSPSYICLPDNSIRLLGVLFPEIKIIFGRRDELLRIWSAIHHLMAHFEFKGEWQDFCYCYSLEIKHQIDAGRIDHHLQRWQLAFSNENILVISYDFISINPRSTVNLALQHIGARHTNDLSDRERFSIERRTDAIESKRKLDNPPEDLLLQVYNILDSAK